MEKGSAAEFKNKTLHETNGASVINNLQIFQITGGINNVDS